MDIHDIHSHRDQLNGDGDMKIKLNARMSDNNCPKWSNGLRFVQWSMNSTYHKIVKNTPYRVLSSNQAQVWTELKNP